MLNRNHAFDWPRYLQVGTRGGNALAEKNHCAGMVLLVSIVVDVLVEVRTHPETLERHQHHQAAQRSTAAETQHEGG